MDVKTDGQLHAVSDHNRSLSTPCSGELKSLISYLCASTQMNIKSMNLPNNKIQDVIKLKAFADDKFNI